MTTRLGLVQGHKSNRMNNFSISTSDLAKSLQKSAGTLKIAGNEFNEAIALTTAGNAILQDPSKVAAGLRTIALRITGTKSAKKELEELGEDVDDFVITTSSKLNEMVKGLTKTASNQEGISLLTDAGNYRSTYDILQDIADVWKDIKEEDKLTGENRQNALLELLAGKNRSNVLASILEDAELLRRVYTEVTAESAGSAEKELNKYMDSIEGRMKLLTTQMQEFWKTVVDEELVKSILSILTTILETVNKLLQVTPGAILPYLGGIISLFMGSHGVNFVHVAKDLLGVGSAAKVVSNNVDEMQAQFVTLGEGGIDSLGRKVDDVGRSASSLSSTFKAMAINTAIIAAVTALAFALDKAYKSVQELNTELMNLEDEYSKNTTEYETLSEKIKDKSITAAEEVRLNYLTAQNAQLDLQIQKQKALIILAKYKNGIFEFFDKDTYQSQFQELNAIREAYVTIAAIQAQRNSRGGRVLYTEADIESINSYSNSVNKSTVKLAELISSVQEDIAALEGAKKNGIPGVTQQNIDDAYSRLKELADLANLSLSYYDTVASIDGVTLTLEERFRQVGSAVVLLASDTETGLISLKKLEEYFPELASAAAEAGWSAEDVYNTLASIKDEAEDDEPVIYKLVDSLNALHEVLQSDTEAAEEFNQAFDDAVSTMKSLTDAQEKLRSGELTNDDVISLLRDNPNLISSVDWNDVNFGNLSDAIIDEIDRVREEEIRVLQERQDEIIELMNPSEISDGLRELYETYSEAVDELAANSIDVKQSAFGNVSTKSRPDAQAKLFTVGSVDFAVVPTLVYNNQEYELSDATIEEYLKLLIEGAQRHGVFDVDLLMDVDANLMAEFPNEEYQTISRLLVGVGDSARESADAFNAAAKYQKAYQAVLEACGEDTEAVAALTEILSADMAGLSEEFAKNGAMLEYLQHLFDEHGKTLEDLRKDYDDITGNISTLDGAISKLLSKQMTDSDVIDLMRQFKELAMMDDIDLNDKVNFGNLLQHLMELRNALPTPLIEELKELREQIEETASPEVLAEIDTLITGLQRAVTFDVSGADAFTQAISDSLGRTNDTVQSTLSYFDDLCKLQEAIAEGFVMDAEKAWEFAQMFPELSKGIMEYGEIGDGLVELNEEIVRGILEGGDSAVDAAVKQLEAEKATLEAKRDATIAKLEIVEDALNSESILRKQAAILDITREEEVANAQVEAAEFATNQVADAQRITSENSQTLANDIIEDASNASQAVGQGAQDGATNFWQAATSMQTSIGNVIDAAHEMAKSIKAAATGEVAGTNTNRGGGFISGIVNSVKGAASRLSSNIKGFINEAFVGAGLNVPSFLDANPKRLELDKTLSDLSAKLSLDLEGYNNAIDSINGQITTLLNLQGSLPERLRKTLEGGADSSGSGYDRDGAQDAADEFSETFDWIERAIEMVEKAINRLSTTAGNVYAVFSRRNNALLGQVEKVKEELYLQQEAYVTYMAVADSVALSEEYKAKVREGLLQVEIIEDEELANKINLYKEWYDKAEQAVDAIQELQITLGELARQKFDSLSKEFEDAISFIEHRANMVNGALDRATEQGYIASVEYYYALTKLENENLEQMRKEREALVGALSDAVITGAVEEGSEAWRDMQTQINSVTEAIQSSETALISYSNSIRDINWEIFDRIRETVNEIIEESEFLTSLMEGNDIFNGGAITKYGQAMYGLHAVDYQVYMEQADAYAKEIAQINKELANDPYDTVLIERRKELVGLQREMILNAREEKDALKDLTEEGVNSFLEAMKDSIDAYKKMMSEWKDNFEFERNINEQTEAIAALQKQLAAYSGDTSESGMLKSQQTANSLREAQEKLQDTQRDRYISETEKILDSLYDDAESALNERLDHFDELMNKIIDGVNINAFDIRETLHEVTGEVFTSISDKMDSIWDLTNDSLAVNVTTATADLSAVIAEYGAKIGTMPSTVTNTIDSIAEDVAALVKAAELEAMQALKEQQEDEDKTTVTHEVASQNATVSSSGSGSVPGWAVGSGSSSGSGSGSGASGSGSSGRSGGFWIYKKDTYPKNKLNVDKQLSTKNTLNCGETLRAS